MLFVGLAVFVVGHLWKRILTGMYERTGPSAKSISAVTIILGLVLIVLGYRNTNFVSVYAPPEWGIPINWVLMFVAVGLLGAGHSKGRIKAWFRHPMLMSVIVWSVAHLLANGDLASVVLFGTLGLWALSQIFVVNAATRPWERPAPGPIVRDFVLLGITIFVYATMIGLHAFLGVNPFGSIS
ncbi:MAG: NnrU family protein [Pseudomonadota bacterium]